jgi:AbiV family abortive infection protein
MAEGELPEQTKKRIEACLANARDSLRAAKRVLEEEKLPNISFHLTVLALEEIGKAALLGARHIAQSTDGETSSFDRRMDDHSFKLFWALWAPNLARGNVSKDEFEKLRGMAKGLHEERLDAMYVSFNPDEGTPLQQVSERRARTMLDLAEVRLDMEAAREGELVHVSAHAELKWFLEATADPEKRKLIFGQKAFDKLAELGHMRAWMTWLKEQFDAAEAEGRENLQHELARAVPDPDNRGEKKWQLVFRLHSPSQSIRNSALTSWNGRPTWIRLTPVGNDRHAVDVEFTYHEAMSVQELGPLG